MSAKLLLSPLRFEEGDDPDDIKIAVLTRDNDAPSWVRLQFRKTKTGIVMQVIKQHGTEIVIPEGVTIPDVSQGHVVLLSQVMVDEQRKLMDTLMDAADSDDACPSCGRE